MGHQRPLASKAPSLTYKLFFDVVVPQCLLSFVQSKMTLSEATQIQNFCPVLS